MEFGEVRAGVRYRKRNTVYGVIFSNNQKRIAVILHNEKGFLPGGGIEEGENHIKGLKRESIEETGYHIHVDLYIGHAKQYLQTRQKEYIMNDGYFYAGRFGDFVSEPIEADHHLLWLEIEDAVDLLFQDAHKWAVNAANSMMNSKKGFL